jgi:hypothetical protein
MHIQLARGLRQAKRISKQIVCSLRYWVMQPRLMVDGMGTWE